MAEKSIAGEQIRKRKFWKRHIEGWSRSGSSQAAYCRRRRLSAKSFTYWKKIFRDINISNPGSVQNKPVTFVPVQVKTETQIAADMSSGLVLCKDGYRIEIEEGFKAEALGKVLRTLREMQC